jgi:uncharacterized protein YndB with AHSA1/START domain
MSDLKLVKTIYLKARPEHVWKFLTEPEKLAVWFHAGKHTLEEGGPWAVVTNSEGKEGEDICYGKVLEMKPYERLVHTFTHGHLNGVETTCTWTLEGVEGGTVLTLVHEGFGAVEESAFGITADHDIGWDEHFVRLRKVVS